MRSAIRSWAAALAAVPMVVSCGAGRSIEAFCDTLRSEQQRILDSQNELAEMSEGSGDPILMTLTALAMTGALIPDMVTMFERLEGVAPDGQVRDDTTAMLNGYREIGDLTGDVTEVGVGSSGPSASLDIASMTKLFAISLRLGEPDRRLNDVAARECDSPRPRSG